jgi:hypothetical protein
VKIMATDPSAVRTTRSGGQLNASAWSLVAGGVLFALGNLLHPLEHSAAAYAYPTWAAAHVVIFLSVPLLILGFPALHSALERRDAGRLGLVAIVLGVVGLVAMAPGLLAEAFIAPEVGLETMQRLEATGFGVFGGLLSMLWLASSLLLGAACYRAELGPRWAAGVLVLASVVLLIAAGLSGPAAGAAIIAATAAYGLVVALVGWHARDAAAHTAPRRHIRASAVIATGPHGDVARS